MRKSYSVSLLMALLFLLNGCDKFIEPNADITPYSYASTDADGGKWKPILLKSASEVVVAKPVALTTTEGVAALNEVETASANVTAEQQKAIDYWGANGLVRWNEIMRNLVAKYNLAPVANADGTYPIPSAANAAAYPNFPFSNPPYASRAYAYFSAAAYDALISAWAYKYQYNQPAPYQQKSSITARLPKTTLPSYPSEDAVVSGVAEQLLIAFFPLEADFIKTKAEEQRQVRLWAGMNTKQDLTAGTELGKAVATKFIDRSKADNMGKAVGNQAVWDQLASQAQAKYGWQWQSLESPARPPMLPLFGQVKLWVTPSVEAVRPEMPPAIGSAAFNTALDEVRNIQKNPTHEQERIANYWADGLSTYTPPGHWNRIAADNIIATNMNSLRTARTFAYLNMAMMDAAVSCWDTKYVYHYPRPAQADPSIKTLLGVPNFPSYTSGHSTFSAAAANVLGYIFSSRNNEFVQMAQEASESRIYGGIHYRFDCESGLKVGKNIANFAIELMKADKAE
jgi:hypothetical protein